METGRQPRSKKAAKGTKEAGQTKDSSAPTEPQEEGELLRGGGGGGDSGQGEQHRGGSQQGENQQKGQEKKQTLKAIYFNARSIQKKINDLELLVNEKNPDLILICESWCNENLPNSSLNLKNYNLEIRLDRTDTFNGIGGGLLVYAKAGLNVVPSDSKNNFNQYCSFKVLSPKNDVDINLYLIYRSPNSTLFNNELLTNLILNCDDNSLIVGDFNFPSIDWSSLDCDSRTKCFVDAICEKNIVQLVDFPTHVRGNILDLVLSNCPDKIVNVENIGNIANSDHSVIEIEFLSSCQKPENKPNILDWNKADLNLMNDYIYNNLPDCNNLEVEESWNALKNVINDSINLYVPYKSVAEMKRPIWASKYVTKLCAKKRKKWAIYCKDRTNNNFNEYKKLEKQCKKAVQKCKKKYEKKISNSNNDKAFNAYVKSKTKSNTNVGPLKKNGNVIADNNEMSTIFNDYFASVFTIDNDDDINIPPDPKARSELLDIHITPKDVLDKIKNLKVSHSCGPDGISNFVLKCFSNVLCKPLSIIFNKTIQTNVLPSDWKLANVVPIHKKGTKGDPAHYRPIALTCTSCKLCESIIKDKIVMHLDNNLLLNDTQYGFTKGRSTVLNLIEFFDKFFTNIDEGNPVDVIYLDFSKAFDKVSIKKLLSIVKSLGINGKVYKWIENWLTNRKQRVTIKGAFSTWLEVMSGVPQGSVLGPLLFLIFINNIDDCAGLIDKIRKFADDTKLGHCIKSDSDRNALQETLNELTNWSLKWKMDFNIQKCKVMHIGNSNPKHTYYMQGEILNAVESEKDLGVWCDKSLKPSLHCQEASRIAKGVLTQICKTFHYRDKQVFVNLYKRHVRVHLEYAAPVWAPFRAGDMDCLEKVQQKFIGMISGLKGQDYNEKLKEVGLPTLVERRLRSDLIQTFKIVKGIDKLNPSTIFNFIPGDRPATRTGHRLNLVQRHSRTDTAKYAFSSRVVPHWNSLPGELKDINTLYSFKKGLDKHLKSL